MTLHYVTPVHVGDLNPAPHYRPEPWHQRVTEDELIDTRDCHASSEPIEVDVPAGTVYRSAPTSDELVRPDGAVAFVSCLPEPKDGRTAPLEWFR